MGKLKKAARGLLGGAAVTALLPALALLAARGQAGGLFGLEAGALANPLPEGYRVEMGGETVLLSPEELLAALAGEDGAALPEGEAAEAALGAWCVLTHSRLIGEMAGRAEALGEAASESPLMEVDGAADEKLAARIRPYTPYFLTAEGKLVRAEAALSDILAAVEKGETAGDIFRDYGGAAAQLQKAAEK